MKCKRTEGSKWPKGSEFIQFISLNLSEIERIEWLNEKQGAMNSLQLNEI